METTCVILCGGHGRRMGSSRHHKVCFPIAGVPAIVRIIDTLKSAGLKHFLLVVGQQAVDVMETVTRVHPDVSFAYQPEALGTGHAAECAARVLRERHIGGDILITMGDKVIEAQVVRDLVERHRSEAADLTLAALPKEPESSAGRILLDPKSRPLAVVEVADIRRSSETGVPIAVAGKEMSAAGIESGSRLLNTSLYLFRAETLHSSLASLAADNAQQELYLTDTVEQVSANGGATSVLEVADPHDLMGFNTPEELLRIEETLGRRRLLGDGPAEPLARIDPGRLKPAGEWLEILNRKPPSLRRSLSQVYGAGGVLLEPRIRACRRLLERFIESHGASRPVVLARAPGRLNLMGRHVDHRGGYVNTMAINREILLAAAPRDDDSVTLRHLSSDEFPERTFRIRDLLPDTDWLAWMDFISSYTVSQFLSVSRGDWSNYARAAVLRLQHAYPRRRLRGMDCVVWGDIPLGAGLSSSSALVVAMAEASVALNQLALSTRQFVDLCGEGEWFVGSRGGIADQAAIRGGEKDKVSKIGFFPFRIEETIDLPKELSVIIANSQAAVSKSHGARHTFNHRVACYDLAEMLLRKQASFLGAMKHLRDLDPGKLGLSQGGDLPPAETTALGDRSPEPAEAVAGTGRTSRGDLLDSRRLGGISPEGGRPLRRRRVPAERPVLPAPEGPPVQPDRRNDAGQPRRRPRRPPSPGPIPASFRRLRRPANGPPDPGLVFPGSRQKRARQALDAAGKLLLLHAQDRSDRGSRLCPTGGRGGSTLGCGPGGLRHDPGPKRSGGADAETSDPRHP